MSQNPSWFEIRNATAGATDIFLYDAIGNAGVPASAFVDALSGVQSKAINLFVNSPGGDVADGTAIYNALKRHPAAVHATVDGMAASAASFIIQAADKISMGTGAVLMIHDAQGLVIGSAATMTEAAAQLGMLSDNIAQIYADRAGGTAEEWRARMVDETWYNAQAAVDAKLADGLAPTSKIANVLSGRAFNLSNFRNVPDWVRNSVETADIAPEIAPESRRIDDPHARKWPLLVHHGLSGAVDVARMRVARARVLNLNIPVIDREEAIRHLEAHARHEGVGA